MHHDESIKLYIFDADDTLRRSTVEGQPCPNDDGQWELLPGVRERLAAIDWSAGGSRFGIATNQGGIALGYLSYATAHRLLVEMVKEAFGVESVPVGAIEICPHAPHLKCLCRKPHPAMLLRLMRRFRAGEHETLFVGDMDRDAEAAHRAGVRFMWAHEFFGFEFHQ
ncbi:MAG TPA: HAD-IIIA family hydrolase [Pyrinomonadaceae bacterium]|jgi:D-glycero-D-manno-heptose 1,7-bisphosphate phosphatase